MNAPLTSAIRAHGLTAQVAEACGRIAPTWPLDRFIAVNPYWGYVDQPIEQAAAELRARSGTSLLMSRDFYREQWRSGKVQERDLRVAIAAAGARCTPRALLDALDTPRQATPRVPLVTRLLGDERIRGQVMPWEDVVTHQVSQHCAAYFDRLQASWRPDSGSGLYASWRLATAGDRGLPSRRGHARFRSDAMALPADAAELIAAAIDALGVHETSCVAYLGALLQSINGWSAWCAYRRWQARLEHDGDDHIVELLAIRLAWEWLLLDDAQAHGRWRALQGDARALVAQIQTDQEPDWLWQRAIEAAFQEPLCLGLAQSTHSTATPTTGPAVVKAVFCIDVRSEVFRRAFEAADPGIETLGFAGFFGLPIAYSPLGSALSRPQLPGLLAPTLRASDDVEPPSLAESLRVRRQRALGRLRGWNAFRSQPSSGFSFVESTGWLYAGKLLKESLPSRVPPLAWERTGLPHDMALRTAPRLDRTGAAASEAGRAELALSILRAMSLTSGFAPLVLLAGHGSRSANNPHAAGLDCGACGGQSGEVNARVLAALFNEDAVRKGLRERGVEIPASTWFVSGLHETVTDEVTLFDLGEVPASHVAAVDQLRGWLEVAGRLARAERAPCLGLGALAGEPRRLRRAMETRANDWAQVRPEWGLVDNAALIVAPRQRTRHMNLSGRAFLHEYRWQDDTGFDVLEQIMTAPMVVANWINLQYYASTVDNRRYGSGNKVLHNVVGGHIGVFEGNGGDLRTGLPWQSLHDGHDLRHTPLRLSVFIEAPRHAFARIIAAHEVVRQLLDHGWLHLFRIEPGQGHVSRYERGVWSAVDDDETDRSDAGFASGESQAVPSP
ncbi:MAG: DUF2309 domain-containing protein [Caldimonas sp.]